MAIVWGMYSLEKGVPNMPAFVCDECGCVDNTASGFYWGYAMGMQSTAYRDWFEDETKNCKALCAECCPTTFKDGRPTKLGVWHNKFPKKKWDGKVEVLNRKKLKHVKDLD